MSKIYNPIAVTKTPRAATKVVAASNSLNNDGADYVCDGTADEVEIQAAIDAVGNIGGKILLLEGTYNIQSTDIVMDANITLAGCGWQTIINFGGNDLQLISTNKDNVVIRDISLTNSADAEGVLLISGGSDVILSKIKVTEGGGGAGKGIHVNPTSYDFLIEGCQVSGFSGSGVEGMDIVCIRPRIIGCFFESCYNTIALSTSTDWMIVNCEVRDVGYLVLSSLNKGVFANNYVDNGNHNALDIIGSGSIVTGNNFIGGGNAIDFLSSMDNIVFSGNNIPDNGDINISSGARGNIISNNFIDGNLTNNSVGNTIVNNLPRGSIDEVVCHYMKNTDGDAIVAGDVVILKAVAAGNEVTHTTTGGDDKVFGMAVESIANTAYGYIQVLGKTTLLKVDGTDDIAIGDYLSTFTAEGIAKKAAAGDMAFAIALEEYATDDSAGVIDALLITPRKVGAVV